MSTPEEEEPATSASPEQAPASSSTGQGASDEEAVWRDDTAPGTAPVTEVFYDPAEPRHSALVAIPEGPTFEQLEQAQKREHTELMQKRDHEHQKEMRMLEHAHRSKMQKLVLGGVLVVLAAAFGAVLTAVWNHGVTPEFGLDMARLVVPALVGSATTIVGAMFISAGSRKEP
ncbi:hypothetical protein DMC64_02540 [Amycolatopsis sp. WAC 04197]|uniref:hypothetical protein n=1 Tax=Amycolatopsis sp. WAC 04197 TaxID=2203199 RepID=UPI000F7A5E9A|nr:hypothetical protein [Amycolatopsis sp. WAC 04197]RSN49461.1 hypothetical protein DMC64_02540 [Amycolatopsis sp. WAC 04197]